MTVDTGVETNVERIAKEIAKLLSQRGEKLVLAESCTCGMVAAQLGRVPGISESLCGSAVVYRPETKRKWLRVSKRCIVKYTTESIEVAQELASGVLKNTPEAEWSVGVVGHLNFDAAKNQTGIVYVCIARRTKKNKIKIKQLLEHKLTAVDRAGRQKEAVEVCLTYLGRTLTKKVESKKRNSRPVVV